MKKILAVSQDPGGAEAISPVLKDLLKDEALSVITLEYGNKTPEVFKKYGIPLTSLKEFGIEPPPLDKGFKSPEPLEKIIGSINARLVITSSSPTQKSDYSIDRAAILASNHQCPSLSVLDLWQEYAERFQDPHTEELILPTKIAIMDEIAKKSMLEKGFLEGILEITGNPYFDSLAAKAHEFNQEKRDQLREELKLTGSFVITYFSGPIEADSGNKYGFNEKDSFQMLLDAISKFPEAERDRIRILLKMHPRENPENMKKVLDFYNGLNITKNASNSREVMLISDINTSPFSTTLYEAISVDRVALAIQPGISPENEKKLFTYQFRDYIPILKDVSSVFKQINSLQNPEYAEHMAQVRKGLENDGKAKGRVRALAYQLIE